MQKLMLLTEQRIAETDGVVGVPVLRLRDVVDWFVKHEISADACMYVCYGHELGVHRVSVVQNHGWNGLGLVLITGVRGMESVTIDILCDEVFKDCGEIYARTEDVGTQRSIRACCRVIPHDGSHEKVMFFVDANDVP